MVLAHSGHCRQNQFNPTTAACYCTVCVTQLQEITFLTTSKKELCTFHVHVSSAYTNDFMRFLSSNSFYQRMEGPDGDSQAGTVKVRDGCSTLRHHFFSLNRNTTACSTLKGGSVGVLARSHAVICWEMTARSTMLCCTCFKFQPLTSK
jgi:hypothetical protein